ncbi:MAG: tetratricopeptide repeat protein [Candidatus Acidiferrales bacterium]
MKCLTIFAIPLIFTSVVAGAQQVPSPAQNGASAAVTTPPVRTPLQIAETRAQILMARKDYAAALDAYQQILLQDPRNAEALNQSGIAYQELGGLDRAKHFYKMAARADKTFSSPVSNLGTVEFEQRNYGKAISYYNKAIFIANKTPRLDLDLSTLYLNLGYAYFAGQQYPLAMDSFARALALDPNAFEAGGGGGSTLEERSAQNPGLFFFLIAKIYAKKGDAERAAHYLKIARDDGYENIRSAITDRDFAAVINDPRVQEVVLVSPSYAPAPGKTSSQ